MTDLTPEQLQVLQRESLPRLRDPQTGAIYLLVPENLFQSMQKLVDGFARSVGWDDTELDVYEQFQNPP